MSERAIAEPNPAPGKILRARDQVPRSCSDQLCRALAALGVHHAFGIVGGGNAAMVSALTRASIRVAQFRHEGGAAFAAVEAHFASGEPGLVFTTTGPGILNALTGVSAARWDGAKVVLVFAVTSAAERGRWASQETSALTFPISGLFTEGPLFDYATIVEDPRQMHGVIARLELGFGRPQGFVAHVAVPIAVQSAPAARQRSNRATSLGHPSPTAETVQACAAMLKSGSFAIWVGFGARHAGGLVRELAERTSASVLCTPRAKGVFPEDHPLYVGVTGIGGQTSVEEAFVSDPPDRILVLGTRMGEGSSFYNPAFEPRHGFLHVDLDVAAAGAAYPHVSVVAVESEISQFLERLLEHFPAPAARVTLPRVPAKAPATALAPRPGRVRPQYLMQVVQDLVIDGTDCVVMAESGNAFGWATQLLRFREPHRYRVSSGHAAMGHFAAGAVGAGLAASKRPVAIVGDGALLMNNELSTAAAHSVDAIWVVLNDGRYGTVEQGLRALGIEGVDCRFPEVDFVGIAQSVGARGVRVASETELEAAIAGALRTRGPYVVDVLVDATVPSALLRRVASLIRQGTAAGEKASEP